MAAETGANQTALLMDVVHDLRVPDVVNLIDRDLRLDLGEGIPVAVVIVTNVLVIKLRRIGALEGSAERFVVPVFNDVDAVGIEGRHEQNYCVTQNLTDLRLV